MSVNVLKSPEEIINISHKYFDIARGGICVNGEFRPVLRLNLIPGHQPINIMGPIDAMEYEAALIDEYQRRVAIKPLDFNGTSLPIKIDSERFSLPGKLCKWKKYSRELYESSNGLGSVASYLKTFLLEGTLADCDQTLKDLGLHPIQLKVRNDIGPIDFNLFEKLIKSLEDYPNPEEASRCRENLRVHYNTITEMVLESLDARDLAAQQLAGEDFIEVATQRLKSIIIGQSLAIDEVVSNIAAQQHGKTQNQSYLFLGPQGVGKTLLAHSSATLKDGRLISLNMRNYHQETDAVAIMGSCAQQSQGGARPLLLREFERLDPEFDREEGGKKFYKLKNIVIVLDDFESAHQKVKDCFLPLLQNGYIDFSYLAGQGHIENIQYQLESSLINCTSSLYSNVILDSYGEGIRCDAIVRRISDLNRQDNNPKSFIFEAYGFSVLALGPVERGKEYRKFLKKNWENLMNEVKSIKEVLLENKDKVFARLEAELYGDGTNVAGMLSRFRSCFQDTIARTTPRFIVPGRAMRLRFNTDAGGIYFEVDLFDNRMGEYRDQKCKNYILFN